MARKSMPDDARLWELKAQLHDVEARLQRDQSERKALEEEIARQRERIRQDQARAADALERNVAAQWESGRSVTQIATSLARSPAAVKRILAGRREREGITVRRGQPTRDSRKLRSLLASTLSREGARPDDGTDEPEMRRYPATGLRYDPASRTADSALTRRMQEATDALPTL